MDKIWYGFEAKKWHQALPLGNGMTGVMVFGGRNKETLCFNDGTFWSGYPKNQDNPESLKYIKEVRGLVYDEQYFKAQKLLEKKLGGGYGESFLPLGNLSLTFDVEGAYRRELDLSTAVHTVTVGEQKREAFVSYPDKVAVYRITSETPFSMEITTFGNKKIKNKVILLDNSLLLTGNAPDCVVPNYVKGAIKPIKYKEGHGMCYCLRTDVDTDGHVEKTKKILKITNAKCVTLYSTTATGFTSFDKLPQTDEKYAAVKCGDALTKAGKNYDDILSRHIADYQRLYFKQSLSLGCESEISTDKLVKEARDGKASIALVNLFYNFGKYLTIAGSRRGGQPTTLQGLWNDNPRPPWSSNYTVNINTEMNYWGASQTGLFECVEPLVEFVYEIMQHGRSTAKTNYGAEGFCCNHNVDIWRKTSPVLGSARYMFAPLCGAWLVNEAYEHLRYGGLEKLRKKVEEEVVEAARFVCGFMIKKGGKYFTCPSTSPENSFVAEKKRCSVDYATAFDMGIIRQLFSNYLEFAPECALRTEVEDKLSKLAPFTEGSDGLNEWHAYMEPAEKGHRHFSPLYAFYPARVIGYNENRKLSGEVEKLFHTRLKHNSRHIGWSAAWAICIAARLRDGNTAKQIIDKMLKTSVFQNLFDVHPPHLFQIDGNYGFVAGVNEMLVNYEDGVTEILPACPKEWQSGEVNGMYTADGNVLSFKWENGKITELSSEKKIKTRCYFMAEDATTTSTVSFVHRQGSND